MHKRISFCSLLLALLLSSTRNENNLNFLAKKIVNEIVDLALKQHHTDLKISEKCNNSRLMIISFNKINREACDSVSDLVYQLQKKYFGTHSYLSLSLNNYFDPDFTKKNLSYCFKAFLIFDEKLKNNFHDVKYNYYQNDFKIRFKPKIEEAHKIRNIFNNGLENYVRLFQNQIMSEEELYFYYKSLQDHIENFKVFDKDLSYFYIIFDKKHLNDVETEVKNFKSGDMNINAIDLKLFQYNFIPLNQLNTTNLDIYKNENLNLTGNNSGNFDDIFNGLRNNYIEIKNIAFSLKISQTQEYLDFNNLENDELIASYSIKFNINNKVTTLVVYSVLKNAKRPLQFDSHLIIETFLCLLNGDMKKTLATSSCTINKNELVKNLDTKTFEQQMDESLISQKEMSLKITQIFNIFKSHQFDIEEDFDFYKRVCNFNGFLNEISFKYSNDYIHIYCMKNFYDFFVNKINNLQNDINFIVKTSFYKYQAPKEFFENIDKGRNIISTKKMITMQELFIDEASNFKESFYDKFLAVVDIEFLNHNQIFYIFPTFYDLESYDEAYEFYDKEKSGVFESYYHESLYLFDNFSDLEKISIKNCFKKIFFNLTRCELILIFTDKLRYNSSSVFEKLIYLRLILFFEIDLKHSKDNFTLNLIISHINTLTNNLENNYYSDNIDINKLKLSPLPFIEKKFLPISFNMFDFLRLKYFQFKEKTNRSLMRNYKLITKKLFRYDDKFDFIDKNFLSLEFKKEQKRRIDFYDTSQTKKRKLDAN
ncbi:hypothetical protein GVAV_000784 [Gurleya vavrai]